MKRLYKISEVSKILNLVHPITKKPLNYVLRYWEKEFYQLKPKKINDQRYYSSKDIELVKIINFLLKDLKLTITGVKNILRSDIKKLDDPIADSLRGRYYNKRLLINSKKILEKIKKLKIYGKKNSS